MVGFCQLDTNLRVFGKKEYQFRKCLYQIDLEGSLWDFIYFLLVLMIDVGELNLLCVVSPLEGWLRKQAGQAMRSKPVGSNPPWLLLQVLLPGPCFGFLLWVPSLLECDLRAVSRNNPSLSKLLWLWCLSQWGKKKKSKQILWAQLLPERGLLFSLSRGFRHKLWYRSPLFSGLAND